MLKTITTLIRGSIAEADEAVFDANATRILSQQLRDAAAALEHSKRELACAMAHRASEGRAIEALDKRRRIWRRPLSTPSTASETTWRRKSRQFWRRSRMSAGNVPMRRPGSMSISNASSK
jgi:hypothetical protein